MGNTPNALKNGRPFFAALRHFHVLSAFFLYDDGHAFQQPAAYVDSLIRSAEWLDFWVRGIPYPNESRAKQYNAWLNDYDAVFRTTLPGK